MSTFKLPEYDIEVSLPSDLTKDELLNFPAFKNWTLTLQRSLKLQQTNSKHEFHDAPYALKKITIQAIDRFGGNSLGFVKMQTEVKNNKGESLPGCVFLRGPSVGMLVILQPDDVPVGSDTEKHVLLTIQPRIAAGTLSFAELPAGMVDDGTFSGAAAREIKEELDLDIPESELTNLTVLAIPASSETSRADPSNPNATDVETIPRAMFPSAGGCDEYIQLFMHLKRVPRSQLKDWTGKLTGLREDGEKITLKLVKLEDLWREGARDAKALSAWALYSGLKAEGKI